MHAPEGSYSARSGKLHARSALPVYRRQIYPERVFGEAPDNRGVTVWENEGVRLWNLPDVDPGVAILSVISKNHTLGAEVLEGILQAVARAEREFDGLVIWHPAPFAVGANLQQVVEACAAGQWDMLEATVEKFQRASQAFKYAQIPTVAAVQGMALGGGCEFLMHASHRVLALESYIGLVEAGVGLIPAGGGSKEFAGRAAALAAKTATPGEVFRSCNRSSRPSPPLRSPRARARPSRPASPANRTSCCSIRTSCCSWPSARPAPPPRPATCRRPGCRTCRSPAAMASPTSR